MKKNYYYELQAYVCHKGYITIYAYSGTRSNANRKFRSFLSSNPSVCHSSCIIRLRVQTYSSVHSMLSGDSPLRSLPFRA